VLTVGVLPVALPDPRATTYGPMNVPPPQGSLLKLPAPAPNFIAEGDVDTTTFLNTLAATGAGVQRPRLLGHSCFVYTPAGALSCVSTQ